MFPAFGYTAFFVVRCSLLSLLSIQHLTLSLDMMYGPPLAIPNLDQTAYVQHGDINIGVYVITSQPGTLEDCPGPPLPGSSSLEQSETVAYAINAINKNQSLLPNVTLGFVIVNDCGNYKIALAKALSFLPRLPLKFDNQSGFYNNTNSDKYTQLDNSQAIMPYYDVVAVMGPMTSQPSIVVSQLLGAAQIPLVGCAATSDELSDKAHHPYFLRTISPDKYGVEAIVRFIGNKNWSYISVIYEYGAYGENAFDNIKSMALRYSICIATSHKVDDRTDYDKVVKDLLDHNRARVVILYAYSTHLKALFDSVRRFNSTGHFVWVGGPVLTSTVNKYFKGYEDILSGAFKIYHYRKLVPEVYDHIRKLRINSTSNPWFRPVWENLAGCSVGDEACDLQQDIVAKDGFSFTKVTSNLVDGVNAIGLAVHNLLSVQCPEVKGSDVRSCITGHGLLSYLKNVSFRGSSGWIKFDQNGNVLSKYEITQLSTQYQNNDSQNFSDIRISEKIIAIYDSVTQSIEYTENIISWGSYAKEERIVPAQNEDEDSGRPESVCSRPCLVGEYRIQKELTCCWECRTCRENERLVDDNTGCRTCDIYTWPDSETGFTTCKAISLTYPRMGDTVPLIQICVGVLACGCVTIVAASYWYFRNHRIIKAASKELSVLQIVAMYVGYLTVIVFQLTPTDRTCGTLFFMFTLSFIILYAPMIVKALRVYRIFVTNAKQTGKLRFVSPKSQLVMAGILILIQVMLCTVFYILYHPTAKKTQHVRTEKFVELSCDLTLPGLASFLTYNLVLISISLGLAFKTRKLPDNFNESWFIFMCATTTLVIWLAFIPTYFTASRDYLKALLLSLSLILNHTVAQIFLFFPKLYAAACMPSGNVTTTMSTRETAMSSISVSARHRTSRIMPVNNHDGDIET